MPTPKFIPARDCQDWKVAFLDPSNIATRLVSIILPPDCVGSTLLPHSCFSTERHQLVFRTTWFQDLEGHHSFSWEKGYRVSQRIYCNKYLYQWRIDRILIFVFPPHCLFKIQPPVGVYSRSLKPPNSNCGPRTSSTSISGSLLEMQTLRANPRPSEPETALTRSLVICV